MKKVFVCFTLVFVMLISSVQAFAMSTYEFDAGMRKGIDYYNRGLYYEARDEFQWFCDGNWGKMNDGQQKYALDYLGAAKAKISEWESKTYYYDGTVIPDYTRVTGRERFDLIRYYDDSNTYEYAYRYWSSDEALDDLKKYLQTLEGYNWEFDSDYDADYGYLAYFINKYTYETMAIAFYYDSGYIVSVLFPRYY